LYARRSKVICRKLNNRRLTTLYSARHYKTNAELPDDSFPGLHFLPPAPVAFAAFAQQRGLLVSLAVQLRALSEPFGIVHRVAVPLSPAARLLVDELTAN